MMKSLSFKSKTSRIIYNLVFAVIIVSFLILGLDMLRRIFHYYNQPRIDYSAITYHYPLQKIDSNSTSCFFFVFWSDYHNAYILCDDSNYIKANTKELVFGYITDPTVDGDLIAGRGKIHIFEDGIEWHESDELNVANWPFTTVELNQYESVVKYMTRSELLDYYEENGIKPHFAFLEGGW